MMLKSFIGDFALAKRCVESFNYYNSEDLPLTIVVPKSDLPTFAALSGPNVSVLDESIFANYLASEPFGNMRLGYINQQIVKLAFWEQDIYDFYFTLDSELIFVRPFMRSDFMLNDSTPFSILVEDNDLRTDPCYFEDHWRYRMASLDLIKQKLEYHDPRTLTCHGHQVMSSRVLQTLKTGFMDPHGYTYSDLLKISPYEFSWYNFWLQKSANVPLVIREPLVKVLHNEGQHLEYALRGLTFEDIARGYIGIVVNSSFTRVWPDLQPKEAQSVTISRYVPALTLISALARKTRLIPALFRQEK